MAESKSIVIVDNIEIQNMIYTFRDKQVMIDRDLAYLYNVETKRHNLKLLLSIGIRKCTLELNYS